MKSLIIVFILSITTIGFAEPSKEDAYLKAKKDLVVIIHQVKKFKAKPRSDLADLLDGRAIGFDLSDGEKLWMNAQESMLYACSKFFSIADTFSEKELLDECSNWGWLPGGKKHY